MHPNCRSWKLTLSVLIILPLAVCGCHRSTKFEVICIIKDLITMKPLSDVKMVISTLGKDAANFDERGSALTDLDGNGHLKFHDSEINHRNELPRYHLKLEKPGYVTEIIEIGPHSWAEVSFPDDAMPIYVSIYLRPEK